MQASELLHGRNTRLAHSKCLLGEPDLFSINQTKYSNSLFGRDKKV